MKAGIGEIELDLSSTMLLLDVPGKYLLSIKLPFLVNDTRGNAKFDKVKRILTVSLPVVIEKKSADELVILLD